MGVTVTQIDEPPSPVPSPNFGTLFCLYYFFVKAKNEYGKLILIGWPPYPLLGKNSTFKFEFIKAQHFFIIIMYIFILKY